MALARAIEFDQAVRMSRPSRQRARKRIGVKSPDARRLSATKLTMRRRKAAFVKWCNATLPDGDEPETPPEAVVSAAPAAGDAAQFDWEEVVDAPAVGVAGRIAYALHRIGTSLRPSRARL